MKKLLLSLAAAMSFAAHAGVFATIPSGNNGEATIVLLEERHDCPSETLKAVIVVNKDSIALAGCWLYDGEKFYVLWDDATLYSYPMAAATPGPWASKKSDGRKQKSQSREYSI